MYYSILTPHCTISYQMEIVQCVWDIFLDGVTNPPHLSVSYHTQHETLTIVYRNVYEYEIPRIPFHETNACSHLFSWGICSFQELFILNLESGSIMQKGFCSLLKLGTRWPQMSNNMRVCVIAVYWLLLAFIYAPNLIFLKKNCRSWLNNIWKCVWDSWNPISRNKG